MKRYRIIIVLISTLFIVTIGCSSQLDNEDFSDMIGKGQNYTPPPVVVEGPTLKDKEGWKIDSIDGKNFIWYTYQNGAFNAQQQVNVLELDLSNPDYELEFVALPQSDSLSSVALKRDAVGGVNGTYELDASFIKTNGSIMSAITLPEGHLRYWKHEGAITYDGYKVAIGYGTKESYAYNSAPNIFSGAPVLIEDYKPVGETFIGDVSGINLNTLDGEDYRRHQGVRHPRTAVALTEQNKLLLITVDGRADLAAGMTAKELTGFINRYFEPQNALNIDGGGSTTMYVKNSNLSTTDVVNYPCDNGKYDHYGQRSVRTFILIKKKTNDQLFDSGDGSMENPYIIKTARHIQNMHKVTYSKGTVYFRMEADVNMAAVEWQPLNATSPYDRIIDFDGNGHVIRELKSKGNYASLFGVLCGVCKDLGIVDADIVAENGGGILAGYIGSKIPTSAEFTGSVENCYTTGKVSGADAIGGISGNIGKPSGATYSSIKNCYSTASVTAKNETGNSRAGGIVGIVWAGGILENCYAAGDIISMNAGAAGIGAYFDTAPKGCVALNKLVENKKNGVNLGRIAAFMGAANMNVENCWAIEGMEILSAGVPKIDFSSGIVGVQKPHDGETKSKEFLSNMQNYLDAGWGNSWYYKVNAKGYPILLWQYNREDYNTDITGH